MNVRRILQWTLGALAAMSVMVVSCFASDITPVPAQVPEADPTLLIAVGVAAIGYVAIVARKRQQK